MSSPRPEDLYTIGVFQDVEWARRGVDALLRDGFPPESITILAKDTAKADGLISAALAGSPDRLDLVRLGTAVGRGPLIEVLQGDDQGLTRFGVGSTVGRVGFQRHE